MKGQLKERELKKDTEDDDESGHQSGTEEQEQNSTEKEVETLSPEESRKKAEKQVKDIHLAETLEYVARHWVPDDYDRREEVQIADFDPTTIMETYVTEIAPDSSTSVPGDDNEIKYSQTEQYGMDASYGNVVDSAFLPGYIPQYGNAQTAVSSGNMQSNVASTYPSIPIVPTAETPSQIPVTSYTSPSTPAGSLCYQTSATVSAPPGKINMNVHFSTQKMDSEIV